MFAGEIGLNGDGLQTDEVIAQLVIDDKKVTIECPFTLLDCDCFHQAKLASTSGEGLGVKQSVFGGAGGSWPLPRVQFNDSVAASVVKAYGKGNIALIPFDLGEQYLNFKTFQMRDMLAQVIAKCYAEKIVETNTHLVEVILSEKNGREFVQLINLGVGKMAGEVKSFNESLPMHDLEVKYLRSQAPKKVVQFPENKELPFEYLNGRVCFTLEKLDIHAVVEMVND